LRVIAAVEHDERWAAVKPAEILQERGTLTRRRHKRSILNSVPKPNV